MIQAIESIHNHLNDDTIYDAHVEAIMATAMYYRNDEE